MSFCRFAELVLLGLLAGAPAGAAEVLTLARVRQLALADQPQLTGQSAAVRAAREQAVADGQLPDPRLKLGLANLPVEGFALNREPMTQTMIAVEQMLPGGNKRALRAARSSAEADQLGAELAARQRQIVRDASLAFVSLRGAQRQLALARRLSRESAIQVESLAPSLRAGRSGQADYFAARTMVTMAHHREVELAALTGRARAELSRWIGAAANAATPHDDNGMAPGAPRPLAELLAAIDDHPEHAMSARTVGVADADVALAREATRPDKSIEIGYGRRSRAFGDMVSIQFSMDLPLFPRDRQDRGVAARLAQRERAIAIREDHLRVMGAEIAAAWSDWQGAAERLRLVIAEHVPDARARVDSALAAYRGGRGEMAAVIQARRDELEAQLLQVEIETQMARDRVRLAYYDFAGDELAGEAP
ncbi:MAG: TolC family protein [Sterolibacteriaceae bacterium]|uniref:TolC family protein n=1 Tax=Candidatus Methylophosphatis roskildensis TaxID=2899263 RepID=A0A9D7E085_9PROT|nr:TolC family protein [Candidatus Methylophosphatis roskildensis]